MEILEDGDYTFIIYVNGKKCRSVNFYAIREIKLFPQCDVYPRLIWNGEEWIAEFGIYSNMIVKGIHWGSLIETEDGFSINIEIDEISGTPIEHSILYERRNYSLGILPEGIICISAYINGELDSYAIFDISRTITTYIPTTYTTTEVYTFDYTTKTITTVEKYKLITSTIKVKEKTETTKTFQTSQTFKEIKKRRI